MSTSLGGLGRYMTQVGLVLNTERSVLHLIPQMMSFFYKIHADMFRRLLISLQIFSSRPFVKASLELQ